MRHLRWGLNLLCTSTHQQGHGGKLVHQNALDFSLMVTGCLAERFFLTQAMEQWSLILLQNTPDWYMCGAATSASHNGGGTFVKITSIIVALFEMLGSHLVGRAIIWERFGESNCCITLAGGLSMSQLRSPSSTSSDLVKGARVTGWCWRWTIAACYWEWGIIGQLDVKDQ